MADDGINTKSSEDHLDDLAEYARAMRETYKSRGDDYMALALIWTFLMKLCKVLRDWTPF